MTHCLSYLLSPVVNQWQVANLRTNEAEFKKKGKNYIITPPNFTILHLIEVYFLPRISMFISGFLVLRELSFQTPAELAASTWKGF